MYHLTLDLVLTQELYFAPILNFPRLIYLEPVIDIDSFTIGYKFDLAKFWNYDDRDADLVCLSQMFSRSELTITSTLVMRFQECYKTIINCIYNLDTFRSADA